MKIAATLPPMHPGEMLREEFLVPIGLTPYRVAKACGVPRTRIERIAREELGITADTALRLLDEPAEEVRSAGGLAGHRRGTGGDRDIQAGGGMKFVKAAVRIHA